MEKVKLKAVRERLGAMVDALASFVFPEICFVCGRLSRKPICADCLNSFPLITGPKCARCGKPTALAVPECRECRGRGFKFVTAEAAGRYDGSLKEAIHILKYCNGKRLSRQMAELVTSGIDERLMSADVLTFVPMTRGKEAKRGYNQAELLASDIGSLLGRKALPLLLRNRAFKPQSELSFDERRRNVRNAFEAVRPVRGRVLLIDDVYTTGSTVSECARALKRAGAVEVMVATVARTVID
ncbi:MAG: ComF family protein [Actinobacteria bacterium]|nr:ComF family protein [Actinomycetota bacterium]